MIKIVKSFVLSLAAALGGMALVIGERDDSPGLGGIGLIMIGISFYLNYKSSK